MNLQKSTVRVETIFVWVYVISTFLDAIWISEESFLKESKLITFKFHRAMLGSRDFMDC